MLAGALLGLGAPPWNVPYVVWIALALLCEALERLPKARGSRLLASACGFAFALLTHAIALPSLPVVIARYGSMPVGAAWAAALVTWCLQALPYACACGATQVAAARGLPIWLAFPPLMTLCTALIPQVFPWQPGALLIGATRYAQLAELGGAALLTLCAAFAASSLVHLLRQRQLTAAGVLALTLLGPLAYGQLRISFVRAQREQSTPLALGVVQSNARIDELRTAQGKLDVLSRLRTMTDALDLQVDAVIWGESAYPFRLARKRHAAPIGARAVLGLSAQTRLLFGAITYEAATRRDFNSAVLAASDGTLEGLSDKVQLLPFAESLPFDIDSVFLRQQFPFASLSAGTKHTLRVRDVPIGSLICYEDLFPSLSRKAVASGAQVLINLSNDVWFDGLPEQALHDVMARLRAIETRRDLLRVSNTGISSFTAATGEVLHATLPGTRATFRADLRPMRVQTLYTRLGDWVTALCLLLLVLALRRPVR
jgi:apolipoprotein N-acyltransferase